MRWFYGELAALEECPPHPSPNGGLCFKSDRIQLRIRFEPAPFIDNVPVRVAITLSSLEEAAAVLEERKLPYERISGLAFSDRRLHVLDPAGNRVEFRQSTWVGLL